MLHAFARAQRAGKRTALITIVHASGTIRRRLGARLLITEDGEVSGGVSDMHLQGRTLQKMVSVINHQKNKLLVLHTQEADDARFCLPLGYSGDVQVLVEPVLTYKRYNPIELLQQVASGNKDAVLVTVFSQDQKIQQGTQLLYRSDMLQCTLPTALQPQVLQVAQDALARQRSFVRSYALGQSLCIALVQFVPWIVEQVGGFWSPIS